MKINKRTISGATSAVATSIATVSWVSVHIITARSVAIPIDNSAQSDSPGDNI